jgi:hypothetical protein
VARKDANFIDLHAEKLVLGLSVLLVAGGAYLGLGGSRLAINGKAPSELCEAVGRSAEQAQRAILSAAPRSTNSSQTDANKDDPIRALQIWYGPNARELAANADVAPTPGRTQPFGPPYIPVTGSAAERRHLASLVAPDIPVVLAGEAQIVVLDEIPPLAEFDGRPPPSAKKIARPFVSVAAQIDLVTQEANFIAERYPDGSRLTIVGVELQRRDLNDRRGGWETVNAYLPYEPLDRPKKTLDTARAVKFEGLDAYQRALEMYYEYLARPRILGTNVELPPVPYLDEPPRSFFDSAEAEREATRRVKNWASAASKALSGGNRQFREPDWDTAYVLARAAAATIGAKQKESRDAEDQFQKVLQKTPRSRRSDVQSNARAPEKMMPLLAHDLTVEPGHAYVYRLRYEIYNVFAGQVGELADPDDARKLTVFSDWSPPSRPIEVESDTYFYLTRADKRKGDVTITVFKVSRRGVTKQDYRVRVGDMIGRKEKRGARGDFSTGALCIDIDFERNVEGRKETAMVYLDTRDGILRERILGSDRRDKTYKKLSEQRTTARR